MALAAGLLAATPVQAVAQTAANTLPPGTTATPSSNPMGSPSSNPMTTATPYGAGLETVNPMATATVTPGLEQATSTTASSSGGGGGSWGLLGLLGLLGLIGLRGSSRPA